MDLRVKPEDDGGNYDRRSIESDLTQHALGGAGWTSRGENIPEICRRLMANNQGAFDPGAILILRCKK